MEHLARDPSDLYYLFKRPVLTKGCVCNDRILSEILASIIRPCRELKEFHHRDEGIRLGQSLTWLCKVLQAVDEYQRALVLLRIDIVEWCFTLQIWIVSSWLYTVYFVRVWRLMRIYNASQMRMKYVKGEEPWRWTSTTKSRTETRIASEITSVPTKRLLSCSILLQVRISLRWWIQPYPRRYLL